MRYIDTGSRDPKHALGSWLGDVLLGPTAVAALRVQTGFFGSDALGYFESTLQDLTQSDGHTRLLIGSNDGITPRAAVADLLKIAGQPRAGLGIGVVSFRSGFFHPKVFHFERADGSATAYVGSANLTGSGATSLHVEAGIIVDTAQGDSRAVLDSIAVAIDAWFTQARPGLYPVSSEADLDPLVASGVIGVPAPPRPTRKGITTTKSGGQQAPQGHSLKPLVAMPSIQTPLPKAGGTPAPPAAGEEPATSPAASTQSAIPSPGAVVEHWSKDLSRSDAQRRAGHQSAAIALTQGHYVHVIDQTTYFRHQLFGAETWQVETAPRRKPVDATYVPMRVSVGGVDHGELLFRISHAPHRESKTNSPTTYIHLEPLLPLFTQTDLTGRKAEVQRFSDGSYALTIA